MRSLLITAALLFAAGTAAASSIEEVVSGEAVNSSIATISCAECPPLQPKKKSSYVVPELATGTDRVELKEIDGEFKSVRTEAWLGGSPVIFVSKASEEAIRAAALEANQTKQTYASRSPSTPPSATIDVTTKTSAVGTLTRAEPVSAVMAGASREFDPSAFALRLD
ncbi:plant virulence effector HPE1-like domain-containing protein [Ensifer sp. LCM 4579]|uniref:plant virulence effector HPE1-like domain-containing protein n=1 Tax=Ensifer sp. LCM 4579 TaxID=1848292 RepID=UPI0008DAE79B|nr:plant virulence effector HPE1-like domain-containing protein [Ensifer sp. LCM 4579]OHV85554.1 hypothetical protein LCM4579_01855 [Ensifer sp. LCM 4579]